MPKAVGAATSTSSLDTQSGAQQQPCAGRPPLIGDRHVDSADSTLPGRRSVWLAHRSRTGTVTLRTSLRGWPAGRAGRLGWAGAGCQSGNGSGIRPEAPASTGYRGTIGARIPRCRGGCKTWRYGLSGPGCAAPAAQPDPADPRSRVGRAVAKVFDTRSKSARAWSHSRISGACTLYNLHLPPQFVSVDVRHRHRLDYGRHLRMRDTKTAERLAGEERAPARPPAGGLPFATITDGRRRQGLCCWTPILHAP